MTAAKQSKKGPSTARGKRKAARGNHAHQGRGGVRAGATVKMSAAERSSRGGTRKSKPRVTAKKPVARRKASDGVGEQIVDYLRTTLERFTELRLANELRRDALRFYESLRSQEKQVARAIRLQVRHWQNGRSRVRTMQPVRDALQWFDVRRLPVAGHR